MGQSPEGEQRRRVKYVLDTSVFLHSSFLPEGDLYTTPSVIEELKSERKYLIREDLHIVDPSVASKRKVRETAQKTGDLYWLSETDVDVLALALDVGGVLVSDDFHVQNVAAWMRIPFEGVTTKIRERAVWRKRCPICGKEYPPDARICPRCGARLILLRKTHYC